MPVPVKDEVIEIIAEQLGEDSENITPDKTFVEDLGADSLDLTELLMTLEERFGEEIPDEDAEKLKKVGDVISYIEQKQK